ncbi:Multidrug resistance protein [Cryomyces antarcticus]|uniref:Multidrug resistance protein n=1 Tax=Cryomyces antarcticus TaxID=329879 RepID=A0ABR0JTR4_9PEZI|nr:Multidrug resistance protein [Cryomyces antarcticus]
MFLLIWMFLLFTCTFTDLVIAGIETAETGGNMANLAFTMTLIFCGVLANPTALPGFWIFMYRLSPFTYLISAMLSTAVANTNVVCADNELLTFQPLNGQTCATYMSNYISVAGGYLPNPQATADCSFCTYSSTNVFLSAVSSSYSTRWRDFGIMWAYIVFNVAGAFFLYWLIRVPKTSKKSKKD